jgi:CMP-N,N'-diacetyllegionaminic acid synthase
LATDEAGKLAAIRDLIRYEEEKGNVRYDYILDLDISSPLRNLNDLESAFGIIHEDEHALNLFSVNPANRNPYFNMVEQQHNGYYGLIKKGDSLTRQSAPKVYDLNASFYFYRRSFFDSEIPVVNQFSMIYVMPHLCFDLDHEVDFKFMEFLIENNQLGFDL